jgi:hypothetical protein
MAQFRRRPELVEAVQWRGGAAFSEHPAWLADAIAEGLVQCHGPQLDVFCRGERTGERMSAPGAWLVRLEEGRFELWSDADFTDLFEVHGVVGV